MKFRVKCKEPKKWYQIRCHEWEFDPAVSYIADGYFISACRRCKKRISECLPWAGWP